MPWVDCLRELVHFFERIKAIKQENIILDNKFDLMELVTDYLPEEIASNRERLGMLLSGENTKTNDNITLENEIDGNEVEI